VKEHARSPYRRGVVHIHQVEDARLVAQLWGVIDVGLREDISVPGSAMRWRDDESCVADLFETQFKMTIGTSSSDSTASLAHL
jgi:hypothetical protein